MVQFLNVRVYGNTSAPEHINFGHHRVGRMHMVWAGPLFLLINGAK